MILTKIMVIMVGARQPAESVTPIRAIGATRVVPSFVCSHSPAHLSGKARAGAGRRRLKVPIRKEGRWKPVKVKEELKPGAATLVPETPVLGRA